MIVVEDSALLRTGLVRLLRDEGVEVAAECADTERLLDLVAALRPDAVLLDIRMPPTHTDEGLRAAQRIRARHRGTGVLLLSQYVETGRPVQALLDDPRGFGYLLKEKVADPGELVSALCRVAAGESVVDPQVVARLMEAARAAEPLAALTARERDVLELMAQGHSNEAISRELVIGAKTVETHVRNVFAKLGLDGGLMEHRRVKAVLAYLGS
ncbi:LuxR C-terminal-related transcriptional regulator [Streptomyces polyrhachis]|uniref:LuxR C-terminal-related transcriptional regulator n=1 Tax=Streptomyces polyrhachis TaxID=1282885 RepID=A0ABW2GA58_9ACTN